MIIGLGSDIIHIERIEAVYKRFGEAFLTKILTPHERAVAATIHAEKKHICYLAKRFAAKEACVKALGSGFRQGIGFQDITITSSPLQKPELLLTGKALGRLHSITPAGTMATLHLSLSDDYPLAQAVVIISADTIPSL